MKKFYLSLTALLLACLNMTAQKIAYVELMSETPGEEQKAKTFFDQYFVNETFETCPQSIGKFLNTNDILNNTNGCMDDVSVLWLNADHPQGAFDNGVYAREQYYNMTGFVDYVRNFVKNGGTLLLTKEAVPMINMIGRMYAPSIKSHTDFTQGNVTWVVKNTIGNDDRSGHAIYQGVPTAQHDGNGNWGVALEKSTSWFTDTNCGWGDLYPKGDGLNTNADAAKNNDDPQKLAEFETGWNCKDLGTWGHIGDYYGAFIVEFLPGPFNGEEWKGTVLTIGAAAYQWVNENEYKDNVALLTKNTLHYLLTKANISGDSQQGGDEQGGGDEQQTTGSVIGTSGDVAMLIGANTIDELTSADEKQAAQWFKNNYVDKNKGRIYPASVISSLSSDIKVLWVAIDRVGISAGYNNLPDAFKNTTTITTLTNFVKGGGNLLLTNHATQLAVAVGRISNAYAPNIFGSSTGGQNDDTWGCNGIIGYSAATPYNHTSHVIYSGLTTESRTDSYDEAPVSHDIFPLEGAGIKGDHNCMWDLNGLGLADNPDKVKDFEQKSNASVLGTWQQVLDYCCAGIVDFLPTTTYKGHILAVGLAAYEWDLNGGANAFLSNVQKLTSNSISYLLTGESGEEQGGEQGGGDDPAVTGDYVAHFTMTPSDDKIKEAVSNVNYMVNHILPVTTGSGIDGQALHFDGSTFVKAGLPTASFSKTQLTISVTLAAETYPMMVKDEDTDPYGLICGNRSGSTGFAFLLSSRGNLRFEFGNSVINGNTKLPRGKWSQLTAVLDRSSSSAKLYLNGTLIGSANMGSDLQHGTGTFFIGKDNGETIIDGSFLGNTFCGLIDDISVTNGVVTPSSFTPTVADFNYPESRYANNPYALWRPQFHGMPSGNWTNESHGMLYSGGKYHVFFQKNANGPYMSRLHWGHISSENLYNWHEEPIAFGPDQSFDMKGCWSGCVYDDNGTPTAIYTGVDYGKARMVMTTAKDAGLVEWQNKKVIVDGRPGGLSDDFRDPYHFTLNGQEYLIVGTSKDGKGACTLHKRNGNSWSNDGTIFFQASGTTYGTFWEMPNVTPMGDGKWLFTCTPLGCSGGTRTLCWVGTIGSDGKFTPLTGIAGTMQPLELNGINGDGYGLLSPTIYQHDGRTLLLGIVPDKLPGDRNRDMGWAHNYSLPREISLDASSKLVQKPYSGLTGMRTTETATISETLNGTKNLLDGRQLELLGEFSVGTSGECGFRFLDQAELKVNVKTGKVTLDLGSLERVDNGKSSFEATIPANIQNSKLKIHLFLDGSIVDVFVNDTYAFSARLFPTNANQTAASVFTTTGMEVKAQAWVLDPGKTDPTGIENVEVSDYVKMDVNTNDNIYNLQGQRLNAVPQHGIYIKNGKKYVAH